MREKRNPLVPIIVLGAAVVGAGLSTIKWGESDGVYCQGWPIPSRIDGLPEDAPSFVEGFASLGALAIALNIGIAILGAFLIWAIVRIILRITGR